MAPDVFPNEKHIYLESWNLPETILKKYGEFGINSLFEWQLECLQLPGVLQGRSIVYSAPTSAGKTLVAELLLLKRVLEERKKAIFIVPFVSMAREKTHYLQRLLSAAGLVVEGFMGCQAPAGGLAVVDVAVCTIEKANNLCNRLLQEGTLHTTVGVVVVDELHLVGDGHRGYLLELLLTKLRYTAVRAGSSGAADAASHDIVNADSSSTADTIAGSNTREAAGRGVVIGSDLMQRDGLKASCSLQVIGMSATLPNLSLLSSWLHAALYVTHYRPVPLTHRLLCGGLLYDSQLRVVGRLDERDKLQHDPDCVLQACLEPVVQGYASLVFCATRARTEALAVAAARQIHAIGTGTVPHPQQAAVRAALDGEALMRVMRALQRCPAGLDKTLACCLQYGTAFHHAGLTVEERDIVEAGYRMGSVRVLVATTTLSSGVNLPARRVLVRGPGGVGGRLIDPLQYHQMAGRAGRKGVDTEGECVVVCSGPKELRQGQHLLTASLPVLASCLVADADGDTLTTALKRAVLEVVVSGAATSMQDVALYCSCTLLAASLRQRGGAGSSTRPEDMDPAIRACIKYLLDNEFVSVAADGALFSTQLGRAVLCSGLGPDEGLLVFQELHAARQGLVLDTDFHMVMLVTPIYLSCTPDWAALLEVWDTLPAPIKRVAKILGVRESFMVQALKGTVNTRMDRQAEQLRVQSRFFTALALHELLQGAPLASVAHKYSVNKGALQSLQQSTATFAGMVAIFCKCLGWRSLASLVHDLEPCLELGVPLELSELARLPRLSARRARLLHQGGLTSLRDVATASFDAVTRILVNGTPFESRVYGDVTKCKGRVGTGSPLKRSGELVWVEGEGYITLAEEAAMILHDARNQLMKQLGVSDIKWGDGDVKSQHLEPASSAAASGFLESEDRLPLDTLSIGAAERTSKLASPSPPDLNSNKPTTNVEVETPQSPLDLKLKKPEAELKVEISSHNLPTANSVPSHLPTGKDGGYGGLKGVSALCSDDEPAGEDQLIDTSESTQLDVAIAVTISDVSGVDEGTPGMDQQCDASCGQHALVNETVLNSEFKFGRSITFCNSKNVATLDTVKPLSTEKNRQGLPQFLSDSYFQDDTFLLPSSDKLYFSVTKPDAKVLSLPRSSASSKSSTPGSSICDPHFVIPGEASVAAAYKTPVDVKISQQGLELPLDFEESLLALSLSPWACQVPLLSSCQPNVLEFSDDDLADVADEKCNDDSCDGSPTQLTLTCTSAVNRSSAPQPSVSILIDNLDHSSEHITSRESNEKHREVTIDSSSREVVVSAKHHQAGSSARSHREHESLLNTSAGDLFEDSFFGSFCTLNIEGESFKNERVKKKDISLDQAQEVADVEMSCARNTTHGEPRLVEAKLRGIYSEHKMLEITPFTNVIDLNERQTKSDIKIQQKFQSNNELERYPKEIQTEQAESRHFTELDMSDPNDMWGFGTPVEVQPVMRGRPETSSTDHTGSSKTSNKENVHPLFAVSSKALAASSPCVRSPKKSEFVLTSLKNVKLPECRRAPLTSIQNSSISNRNGEINSKNVDQSNISFEFDCKLEESFNLSLSLSGELENTFNGSDKDEFNCCLKHNVSAGHPSVHSIEDLSGEDFNSFMSVHEVDRASIQHSATRKVPSSEISVERSKSESNCSECDKNDFSVDCLTPLTLNLSEDIFSDSPSGSLSINDVAFSKKDEIIFISNSLQNDCTTSHVPDNCFDHEVIKMCVSNKQSKETLLPKVSCTAETPNDVCCPKPASIEQGVQIVNVCGSRELLDTFLNELRQQKSFSLTVALKETLQKCETALNCFEPETELYPLPTARVDCSPSIFPHRVSSKTGKKSSLSKLPSVGREAAALGSSEGAVAADGALVGVAIAFTGLEAYYISLQEDGRGTVPMRDRYEALQSIVGAELFFPFAVPATHIHPCGPTVRALLRGGVGLLRLPARDPITAAWTMGREGGALGLQKLVTEFTPELLWLWDDGTGAAHQEHASPSCGGDTFAQFRAAVPQSRAPCWQCRAGRATRTAVLLAHLVPAMETRLKHDGLWRHWAEVEMPCRVLLTRLELNGVGFSGQRCRDTVEQLRSCLSALQSAAHRLVGRTFRLDSFKEVAGVLYGTLRLPQSGGWRGRLSKEALLALQPLHPLPGLILQWRGLHAALHKMLLPLWRHSHCAATATTRIHPRCHTTTATGRVSMAEPSLQCMPRDVTVRVPRERDEGEGRFITPVMKQLRALQLPAVNPTTTISCRRVVVAGEGRLLLAADYSQLELRVLAHCCQDPALIRLLSEELAPPRDAFTHIAAEILNTGECVSEEQRNVAKQLCYGILYGMGAARLAAQLRVPELEATAVRDRFLRAFPGVERFLRDAVANARRRGYAETITGRRRYLPGIDSGDAAVRSQCERQAVNSVVQGSAADLVKTAMVNMDRALDRAYPYQPPTLDEPYSHQPTALALTFSPHTPQTGQQQSAATEGGGRDRYVSSGCRDIAVEEAGGKGREGTAAAVEKAIMKEPSTAGRTTTRGVNENQGINVPGVERDQHKAHLVLQLHDELIYEVLQCELPAVAALLRRSMEDAVPLAVPLPVKMKAGPSWGEMTPFES